MTGIPSGPSQQSTAKNTHINTSNITLYTMPLIGDIANMRAFKTFNLDAIQVHVTLVYFCMK